MVLLLALSLAAQLAAGESAEGPPAAGGPPPAPGGDRFEGKHYRGRGDPDHLELLDLARRMFEPDPELQNLSMLYMPAWNGLVEGPTWDAWWIQNSYGTTYCALPFLEEPFLTFLQNSQDLWFDQMGDGKRSGFKDWVAPDGCLCDAARPGWIVYKQGDGRVDIHDWGMEFTAAGVVLQAELLLEGRDLRAIARYLPKLERCADFIESRRDPRTNLYLAGPAGNLLAPSYAGWRRPDGTFGLASLAGLTITSIAALDRLVELEKLAGRPEKAALLAGRRELSRKGLPLLTEAEGYLVKSIDPDGVRHGVFGADRHGYFESSPNHDAIAFRVVDDEQSARIYAKIASIPGLRPHDFIIPNFPSLDDMYEKAEGLWAFGTWVNGGHWSTCEARMVLAYSRLGKHEDARRSMKRLLGFARRFRMDNPLTKFGSDVYQPNEPVNLCYDSFGPAAALLRGLFEYLYDARGLRLEVHVPPGITEMEQIDAVRLGRKRFYLSTVGSGGVAAVEVNGAPWPADLCGKTSISFPDERTPDVARVTIFLGAKGAPPAAGKGKPARAIGEDLLEDLPPDLADLKDRARKLLAFRRRLLEAGLGGSHEAAHAELCLKAIAVIPERRKLQAEGKIPPLPGPSQTAADRSYVDTALKLCSGLEEAIKKASADPGRRKIGECWGS